MAYQQLSERHARLETNFGRLCAEYCKLKSNYEDLQRETLKLCNCTSMPWKAAEADPALQEKLESEIASQLRAQTDCIEKDL